MNISSKNSPNKGNTVSEKSKKGDDYRAIKKNYKSTTTNIHSKNRPQIHNQVQNNKINKGKNIKRNFDSDLIQAYETIFEKSKETQMKNMAKKFL